MPIPNVEDKRERKGEKVWELKEHSYGQQDGKKKEIGKGGGSKQNGEEKILSKGCVQAQFAPNKIGAGANGKDLKTQIQKHAENWFASATESVLKTKSSLANRQVS